MNKRMNTSLLASSTGATSSSPERRITGNQLKTTIVVSDVHLASPVCRAKSLRNLLKDASFERLIILGDLFEDARFRRLDKSHWQFLSLLRKLSSPKRGVEIVWIEGNHDREVISVVSHMIGAKVIREHEHYVLECGGKRILFMHGHQFDDYIDQRPMLTAVATGIYNTVQRCGGRGKRVSRWLKYKSKSWMNASAENARRALHLARTQRADIVICGHTHATFESQHHGVRYINTGSWVDIPSQYVVINEQGLELRADWSED